MSEPATNDVTRDSGPENGNAGSLHRMVSLQPGTRYTKDGISVDIDCVKEGEVYVRRWPKGVESQPFFANCIRMPVGHFMEQVQDATMEANAAVSGGKD